ncbi:SLC13 family permease [Candidatus Methanomassiliicoccus intestinalis]|uniref:SLC13 family permease n=1 Tax=Candidatus Methanomassiliicoccus intestinalis TaxID=1406512 RepID=UPI0037DDCDD7
MLSLRKILKNESLLVIAALLAAGSFFLAAPGIDYAQQINFPVIILLFCLMAVVAGLNEAEVFPRLFAKLTQRPTSIRRLSLMLVLSCFFAAMVLTNDVALITLVPLTMLLLRGVAQQRVIFIIVMETIAANLGSMLTPVGSPQNIFLYAYYDFSLVQFLTTVAPVAIFSLLLISVVVMLPKDYPLPIAPPAQRGSFSKFSTAVYLLLFIIAILAVVGLVHYLVCLLLVVLVLLLNGRSLFRQIDYSLLLTFLFFFIFSANIGSIAAVHDYLVETLSGQEFAVSVLLSQVISNVPTAVLLAPFTADGPALLLGTNIGGLGTPIASLASLISYRLYTTMERTEKIPYLKTFLMLNLFFLVVLVIFAYMLN